MLKQLDLRGKLEGTRGQRSAFLRSKLPWSTSRDQAPINEVKAIMDDVRCNGDEALVRWFARQGQESPSSLRVPAVTVEAALREIAPHIREALEEVYAACLVYHRTNRPQDGRIDREGVSVRQVWRPVERVGLCTRAGTTPFPTTVLMTGVPARVAGVEQLALCASPGADGRISPVTLAAAALVEVDEVYAVGGVAAIAAMAYGTESIAPVDSIVGPVDSWTDQAKREVADVVGLPSFYAGPSEVVVVADETTPVEYAAIDLVVQAEHGLSGSAWLITWSPEVAAAITETVEGLVARSTQREQLEATLAGGGHVVLVDDPTTALDVANAIAPEHLQLMTVDPEALVPLVRHAGAVYSGAFSPASAGDYMGGPSHVLPVHGSARFAGALGVHDFLRNQHVISFDEAALGRLAPHVATLADVEQLEAHSRSVRMRLRP